MIYKRLRVGFIELLRPDSQRSNTYNTKKKLKTTPVHQHVCKYANNVAERLDGQNARPSVVSHARGEEHILAVPAVQCA